MNTVDKNVGQKTFVVVEHSVGSAPAVLDIRQYGYVLESQALNYINDAAKKWAETHQEIAKNWGGEFTLDPLSSDDGINPRPFTNILHDFVLTANEGQEIFMVAQTY